MKNAASLTATLAVLSGCSLINSLDSVKPPVDEDAGATGGAGGKGKGGNGGRGGAGGSTSTGTSGSAGKGGHGGAAGDTGTGGTDGGLGMGGTSTDSGAGGTGGDTGGTGGMDAGSFTSGGPNGAIVAYDPIAMKVFVLDPTDAHAISSEEYMHVLAIANDPATDYWYFFRQPGKMTDPAEVQVRELNTTSGAWHDVGAPVSVPFPTTPSVAVLNQRIAYLSFDATNPNNTAFSVLDTSKPAMVTVASGGRTVKITAPGGAVALTAHASTSGVGGTLTVGLQAQGAACDSSGCAVNVLGVTINATTIKPDATPTMVGTVSATGGSMGFASMEGSTTAADLVIAPPTTITGAAPTMCTPGSGVLGSALLLDGTHSKVGNAYSFDIANLRVSSAAFDPCHNIGFATSLLGDTAVWAIPLVSGGSPYKACVTTAGGAMFFEPYTHGLIRLTPAAAGATDRFEIYDIKDSDPTTPVLTPRMLKFPAVFSNKGGVLAVRRPKDVCK